MFDWIGNITIFTNEIDNGNKRRIQSFID